MHQLRMVDLRARLRIMEEKSAKVGVKPRGLQALTQACSKVWPEETMTGSAMREPKMGQRNSFGGCFGLGLKGFEGDEEGLVEELPFSPGSGSLRGSLFFCVLPNAHLVCMGL